MNKSTFSVVLTISALMPVVTHANIVSSLNEASFSYLSLKQNYSETEGVATLDSESGTIPGIGVTLRATNRRGAYGQLGLRYFSGNDTYVGALQNGTPANGLTGNRILEFEGRLGQAFDVATDMTVLPYLEAGIRTWKRNLGGPEPYTETYRNDWIGAGVKELFAPRWAGATQPLVLSLSGSIATTFSGSMATSGLVNYGVPDESFGLGDHVRYALGLDADYALTDILHLRIGARWEQFGYGASAPVPIGGGYEMLEPDSATREFILHAGVAASF
ncbi:MAG: hypothetical protein M0Z84_11955 [Gammaproteobacteria bacterium]|nr:hypothetical protein [Gammaproteobacteria bacterium]